MKGFSLIVVISRNWASCKYDLVLKEILIDGGLNWKGVLRQLEKTVGKLFGYHNHIPVLSPNQRALFDE